MPEFPSLTREQLERLAARGIDPERSYERMLAEIRDGSWLPGLTLRRHMSPSRRVDRMFAFGYPAALVLTDEQLDHVRQPRRKKI